LACWRALLAALYAPAEVFDYPVARLEGQRAILRFWTAFLVIRYVAAGACRQGRWVCTGVIPAAAHSLHATMRAAPAPAIPTSATTWRAGDARRCKGRCCGWTSTPSAPRAW
jgi:hypothetical protein